MQKSPTFPLKSPYIPAEDILAEETTLLSMRPTRTLLEFCCEFGLDHRVRVIFR